MHSAIVQDYSYVVREGIETHKCLARARARAREPLAGLSPTVSYEIPQKSLNGFSRRCNGPDEGRGNGNVNGRVSWLAVGVPRYNGTE